MRITNFLERPIVSYIILSVFSLAAAVIFFQIGGSLAEVTGQENTILGFSFKAGGAIAGFVIILVLSLRGVEKLREITPEEKRLLREYILRLPDPPEGPTDSNVRCTYRLYDQNAGGWGDWKPIDYVREGRGFRIYVEEMQPNHIISVKIEDSQNNLWSCDEDQPYGVSPIYFSRG
jgi:hypothetical protein